MSRGLYAEFSTPPWLPARAPEIVRKFSAYGHEIQAIGGFWKAQMQFLTIESKGEDWLENGVARFVTVFSYTNKTVFRGFVNSISINTGATTWRKGPLLEVVNHAATLYTPLDWSVFPPVQGTPTITAYANDSPSQKRYGLHEGILQVPPRDQTYANNYAERARDRYLEERHLPKITSSISVAPGSGARPVVTLEILGLVHWLKQFVYAAATGSTTVRAKLGVILASDPNTVLNPTTNYLAANAFAVGALEAKNRRGLDIILSDLLPIGDGTSADIRMLFGVYDNDAAHYEQAPSSLYYEYNLSHSMQAIRDYSGRGIIDPWDVRPGKWITVPDFLIGRGVGTADIKDDPRNKFIESVKFTAPHTVDLSGGSTDKLSQILAKLTYSGAIY